jgi:hypothetical protein
MADQYSNDQVYAAMRQADAAGDGDAVKALSAHLSANTDAPAPAQASGPVDVNTYKSTLHGMLMDPKSTPQQIHDFVKQAGYADQTGSIDSSLAWRAQPGNENRGGEIGIAVPQVAQQPQVAPAQAPAVAQNTVALTPSNGFMSGLKEASNAFTAGVLNPVAAAGNAVIPGIGQIDNPGMKTVGDTGNFSDAYHNNLQILKGQDHANEAAHPIASKAGEFTGAVLSPLNKVAGPVEGAGVLANGARLFAGGATYGGINGAATSNADTVGGVLKDTAAQSLAGGAGAAVIGTGLTQYIKGAGHVFDAAARLTGHAPNVGANLVAERLAADNLSPADAAAAMTAARANGTPSVLADLGENARALGGSVSRQPGAARNIATTTTLDRQMGQGDRVKDAISRDLGPTTDTLAESNRLMAEAKAKAGPLYAKFHANPARSSPEMESLLQTPAGRNALNGARLIAANERVSPDKTAFGLNDQGETVLTRKPSPQSIDYVKQGLDDILEGYRDKTTGKVNLDRYGRSVESVRASLVKESDRLFPDYAAARRAYAGPAAMRQAMQDGKAALNKSPNEINQRLINMSPAETQHYALGLRSAISDALDRSGDGANKVRLLIGTPQKRAVLARVFGNTGDVDRLVSTLGNEQAAHLTYQAVHGGSPTATRLAEDQANSDGELLKKAAGWAGAAKHGVTGLIGHGVGEVSNALQFGVGEAGKSARENAAALLFSSNPSDFHNTIVSATRSNRVASQRVNALNLGVAKAGGKIGMGAGIGLQNALMHGATTQ